MTNEQLYIRALKQEYIKLMMYISSQNKEIRRLEEKIEQLKKELDDENRDDNGSERTGRIVSQ
jgi:predicted RNase H-like nuclease (RuvC/YqgF family)